MCCVLLLLMMLHQLVGSYVRLCSLVFLTMIHQGNVQSFHVKSNRLLYTGFSAGFRTQELILVAGSFQKGDVVRARIKKMPIDFLLATDRSAGGGQARLAWLPLVSSPVELTPR